MHLLPDEILETIKMVDLESLDIRTVTMGISLLDCIDKSAEKTAENIYNKITRLGKNLVVTADKVAAKYGVPIVNKRVSVTPIAIVGNATDAEDYTIFAKALDKAAKEIGIDFIGGFTALVDKGFTEGDKKLIASSRPSGVVIRTSWWVGLASAKNDSSWAQKASAVSLSKRSWLVRPMISSRDLPT